MIKLLLALTALSNLGSPVATLANTNGVSSNTFKLDDSQKNGTYSFDNNSNDGINYVNGITSSQVNGIYIDSTKDTYKQQGSNDKIVSHNKVKRNTIYTQVVKDFSYTLKDGETKEQFLNDNKNIYVSYLEAHNFWNSYASWSYIGGKNIVWNQQETNSITLTGNTNTNLDNGTTYFLNGIADSRHSSNERVWFGVQEVWQGNTLTLNLVFKSRVHWASGSPINHAAIVKATQTIYYFSKGNTVKNDTVNSAISFSTKGPGDVNISLVDFNKDLIKAYAKNPTKTKVGFNIAFAALGTFTSGNHYAIDLESYLTNNPASLFVRDANKVINGSLSSVGTLSENIMPSSFNITYTSPDGSHETSPTVESEGLAQYPFDFEGFLTFACFYQG